MKQSCSAEVRMKPAKVSRIIVVCAVLHNLQILWNEPEYEDTYNEDQPGGEVYEGRQDGRGIRAHVADHYFN
ncbi:hypothetical protein ACF0H5_009037 [Mactra antiquata]